MDYELAKKLRDAGFVFTEIKGGMHACRETIDFCPDFDASKGDSYTQKCHFFVPTLSELIEACGDRFCNLNHVMGTWRASAYPIYLGEEHAGKTITSSADSSVEAVAKVWLQLKEKNNGEEIN